MPFQTQIFFLLTRYKQQQELFQADLFHRFLITDYIFEKDKIFAYLNLQDEELKLYETLVGSIQHNIPTPDLVVYLQASVPRLMANIKRRARTYEHAMSEEYIRDLNEAYNYFFFRYKASPLLIVNSTEIDFVNDPADFEDLVRYALGNSYNIPAVKTLQFIGIYDDPNTPAEDGFLSLARRMGISTLNRPDYGLSLTLGGGM